MSAGHSCRGSQSNSQCPSFPAHHCTSGSLLPAAVTHLATSCSGASQELRRQQAPSSQQANSPLNYCCLAMFSRLQSQESAESIASHSAPSSRPAMLCGGAGTSPHHPHPPNKRPLHPPVPRTRAHLRPPRPRTEARGAGLGRRRALGRAGTLAPAPRLRGPTRPTSVPATWKSNAIFNLLSCGQRKCPFYITYLLT